MQDGSFDLESRDGCTEPVDSEQRADDPGDCRLDFALSPSSDQAAKIASIKIGVYVTT